MATHDSPLIAAFLMHVDEAVRVAEVTLYPVLNLAIRLLLAQAFWVSGVLKLANWDVALTLATHEDPVSWLDPFTVALLCVGIEFRFTLRQRLKSKREHEHAASGDEPGRSAQKARRTVTHNSVDE